MIAKLRVHVWLFKMIQRKRDSDKVSERLHQHSDCESFLFDAQAIIYLSLFLIRAVTRAVECVFELNMKQVQDSPVPSLGLGPGLGPPTFQCLSTVE